MEKIEKKVKKQEMFENIIGYDDIKSTLKTIVDMLNNQHKYKRLGCVISHGLLLYGPPGTGKTSIANKILNNVVDRKTYIIRKNKSDGSFIEYMNSVFKEAIDNQPSIILLDDLDKFSEIDNDSNQEEYVAVQSLIDEIKNDDVFVIATANEISSLPKSLKRSGRFDIKILINNPKSADALKIFSYYLKAKKIDKNINVKNISYILTNSSCADLEKVCNQAAIYAGYKNKNKIGFDELIRSALELKYDTNIEDINREDKYAINVAYHEAGHALIGELLEPGSISFITIANNDSSTKGMTIFQENEDYFRDVKFMKDRIKSLLAGKAATEIVFNTCDTGTDSDIRRVYNAVRRLVDNYCLFDFNSWITDSCENSEKTKQAKDDNTNKLISDYYNEVKELLMKNRNTLDKLANELKNKKILFQDEIQNILNKKG